MAVIKCKMCGGDLVLLEGETVAECEYCGSRQTVPVADNEKKLTLFARANRLRAACEFDKAAGIYEAIVADFPEEAEAYWGLILCKYGIEYITDPNTGKKVPTCHRSSYDSVMDDSNFEQTLENADLMAQRLYREEAKQIEKIRKGILEVSSREKPYDIFICYKEKAPNGDRTLDSVLAQDLYSALTDKGYRVFFARITLQGMLGEAFEPYIFAALNSAKVMLAIGTCYEYYNAVWVKNEWSRYLKICAADKSKHLIPCYRDLEPEDMPREFNHLQGADLGKMGAIQDIIFNMEKYIPLQKNTTTVIQQLASNNTVPLLKRGNMALEDHEWSSAEKFFEEVLNQNAECAEAYIGKALVEAKCDSLDALVQRNIDDFRRFGASDRIRVPEDKDRIQIAIESHAVPGFLEEAEIRKMYDYDLYYESYVEEKKRRKQELLTQWKNNRHLSRANQFSTGATAVKLSDALNQMTSQMNQGIQQAEEDQKTAHEILKKRYAGFLDLTDEEVLQKKAEAIEAREHTYQRMALIARESDNVHMLREAVAELRKMEGYGDSEKLSMHCDEKIQHIQARQEREREERDAAARQADATARALREQQKRHSEFQTELVELKARLAELYKDKKRFGNYRMLYTLNVVMILLFFITPSLSDGGIIPMTIGNLLFGVCFLAIIPIAIIGSVIWWKLWFKYRKFRTGNILQKLFMNKLKFMKKYLNTAIAEAEASIKTVRDQLES